MTETVEVIGYGIRPMRRQVANRQRLRPRGGERPTKLPGSVWT